MRLQKTAAPTKESLLRTDAHQKLDVEWNDMLAHQLPALPSLAQFWAEIPELFDWLYGSAEKRVYESLSANTAIDAGWRPPAMVHAWRTALPLESIRFAAANRLCVNLRYQNSWHLIEPYSMRRSLEGNLLICALEHETAESRAYRVDSIEGLEISDTPFTPKYLIELTPVEPLPAHQVAQ